MGSSGVSPERVEELRQMHLAGTLHWYVREVLLGGLDGLDDEGDNRVIGERRNDVELDGRTIGRSERW
jgi:hypothetical protein